jgi:hypothetical protein
MSDVITPTSFVEALHSSAPAADRADRMQLYGFLIGDWQMHGTIHKDDGTTQNGKGAIHAGWVLQGRALQDVWSFADVFYGTTLRVYDPGIDAWHILWNDPMRQVYVRQIGRPQGHDIVQIGKADSGAAMRWSFTEIKPVEFHWIGERSLDDGASWHLQAEYFARRVT